MTKSGKKYGVKNGKIRAPKMPTEQQITSKIVNSAIGDGYGMGSGCDMGIGGLPIANSLLRNFSTAFRIFEGLYATDWQAQKIIDLPVDDMLRKPWVYEGLDDVENQAVEDYQHKLYLTQRLREALRIERLFGGSAIFMGVASNVDDPAIPLTDDQIGLNSLRFLNTIPRQRVVRSQNQPDPTQPNYGQPLFYFVNGVRVHHSRLLIFDGDPLLSAEALSSTSTLFLANDGFGYPVLLRLYESLIQATGSRQAAYHLIHRASTLVFKGDIMTQMATTRGGERVGELENMLNQINNYNATLLQDSAGNDTSLETLAANFGSVPELILSYLQVLSAASDIPASRFLGQAPGGLNATGTSDLENYYNSIAAKQRNRLEPQLKKLLRVVLPSAGVKVSVDDAKIMFPQLWNPTELEQAQVRAIDTQNVVGLENSGLISEEQALEELKIRDVLVTDSEDFPPPEEKPDQPEQAFDPKKQLEELKNLGEQ